MHLFTSNFKKIITIVFGLFFIYNIYLMYDKPSIVMYQNQQQKNLSFAQDFIYESKAKYVVVGSSMAARMENKFLSQDFFNLSFSGGSVLTGLEIIKKSAYTPSVIYIEANIIFRNKDEKFVNRLFTPILWKIKKYILALREKYQPLTLVASKVKSSFGRSEKEYMKDKRDFKIYEINLQRHEANYAKHVDDYQQKLDNLKTLVKYFEKKGSKIVFFEMPIDKGLESSVKVNEQRYIIKKNFKNDWLELPDNTKYTTSDGIHLMYKSAYEFSKEFLKKVNNGL